MKYTVDTKLNTIEIEWTGQMPIEDLTKELNTLADVYGDDVIISIKPFTILDSKPFTIAQPFIDPFQQFPTNSGDVYPGVNPNEIVYCSTTTTTSKEK